ncbi:hypothetical protein Gohar_018166, partial [Gossypium harknessii]|nr:hypothetical protein [Gossypium harknessii]
DVNSISIGSGTNIQDNSLVHVAKSNLSGKVLPTIIGSNVTVGHSAVLHGCTVEDEAFVGMGATLLDGVYVEKHAMVAAGALVRQNTRIPCGEVWGGNPAKFLRKLTEEEMAFISQSALNYSNLAQVHAAENAKSFDEIEFEKMLRKKFARRDEEYDSMLGVVRETPPELILPDNRMAAFSVPIILGYGLAEILKVESWCRLRHLDYGYRLLVVAKLAKTNWTCNSS